MIRYLKVDVERTSTTTLFLRIDDANPAHAALLVPEKRTTYPKGQVLVEPAHALLDDATQKIVADAALDNLCWDEDAPEAQCVADIVTEEEARQYEVVDLTKGTP